MTATKLKVGLIGLGEAGNFGDDLILLAAVCALDSSLRVSDVKYIGYGQPLDWDSLRQDLGISLQPRPVIPRRDLPGSQLASRAFTDCELVIFGGGGLIQTSHNPERPYQWLRYVPAPRTGGRVIAVGLGLGPISRRWERRLKRLEMPFDECYLRDEDSVSYGNGTLGWQAEICKDFVDPTFLRSLVDTSAKKSERVLGIALRDWVDLDRDELVAHIRKVVDEVEPTAVRFFVLEAKDGRGVDVDFTAEIVSMCGLPNSRICVYEAANLLDFVSQLAECTIAISMKLHSSAVWAAFGVPVYPIVYSPKIAAFFGLPYAGTWIASSTVPPHAASASFPRAQDIVINAVSKLRGDEKPTRKSMSALSCFDSQIRSLFFNVFAKLRKALAHTSL